MDFLYRCMMIDKWWLSLGPGDQTPVGHIQRSMEWLTHPFVIGRPSAGLYIISGRPARASPPVLSPPHTHPNQLIFMWRLPVPITQYGLYYKVSTPYSLQLIPILAWDTSPLTFLQNTNNILMHTDSISSWHQIMILIILVYCVTFGIISLNSLWNIHEGSLVITSVGSYFVGLWGVWAAIFRILTNWL